MEFPYFTWESYGNLKKFICFPNNVKCTSFISKLIPPTALALAVPKLAIGENGFTKLGIAGACYKLNDVKNLH